MSAVSGAVKGSIAEVCRANNAILCHFSHCLQSLRKRWGSGRWCWPLSIASIACQSWSFIAPNKDTTSKGSGLALCLVKVKSSCPVLDVSLLYYTGRVRASEGTWVGAAEENRGLRTSDNQA